MVWIYTLFKLTLLIILKLQTANTEINKEVYIRLQSLSKTKVTILMRVPVLCMINCCCYHPPWQSE